MILLLILGLVVSCSAEEALPAEQTSSCNCSQVLTAEEPTEVYPTFPSTSFTCWGRIDGYYADIEVDCTIFHYCQTWQFPTGLNETVKWDFACPQSTIFNQRILSCTPPNVSFDCKDSPSYYWVNYNLTCPTPLPSVTPEPSTPESIPGQQLIIGGLEPQSAEFSEPTDAANAQGAEGLPPEPTEPFPQPITFTTAGYESNSSAHSFSTRGFGSNSSLESIVFPTSEPEFRETDSYYRPPLGFDYAPIKFPPPKFNVLNQNSNFPNKNSPESEFESFSQTNITV